MKQNKTMRVILEIALALLAIIILYLVIRHFQQELYAGQTSAASAESGTSAGTDTQKQVSVTEDPITLTFDGQVYETTHPIKTYLFIGTDASGNEEGTGEEYRGSMADVLMLVVLDEQDETYGILQLNRDTITRIPLMLTDGSANAAAQIQLCTAHWYGGTKEQSCENTVQAVSDMLGGLPIDGYYALSMDAMSKLNEAVGGVTVTFDEDLTELDPAMEQGATLTLTDEQAEELMHARYEMSDDRNELRMKRQRLFLDAFLQQVKERQEADSDFVIELYDTLHPYSTQNINMNALTKQLQQMSSFASKGIFTIDGEAEIGQRLGDGLDHWEFYIDEDSLETTMSTLYSLTYVGEEESEE